MKLEWVSQDADVVQTATVDPDILGVDMEDAFAKVAERRDRVHLHPGRVGRIVVQAEAGAGDRVEHAPPNGWRERQILAAGPFVAGEDHRAVLDAYPDAALLGISHQGLPDLQEARPVFVHRAPPVPADERIDRGESQRLRRSEDQTQVLLGYPGLLDVCRERVRVVAEAADRDAMAIQRTADRRDGCLVQRPAVDVRDACVATVRLARRPAHDLNAVVPLSTADSTDFVER